MHSATEFIHFSLSVMPHTAWILMSFKLSMRCCLHIFLLKFPFSRFACIWMCKDIVYSLQWHISSFNVRKVFNIICISPPSGASGSQCCYIFEDILFRVSVEIEISHSKYTVPHELFHALPISHMLRNQKKKKQLIWMMISVSSMSLFISFLLLKRILFVNKTQLWRVWNVEKKKWNWNTFHSMSVDGDREYPTILSCTHGIFAGFLIMVAFNDCIVNRVSKSEKILIWIYLSNKWEKNRWFSAFYYCYKSFDFVLVLCSPAGRSNIYFHWMLTWSDERFSAHTQEGIIIIIISRQMV